MRSIALVATGVAFAAVGFTPVAAADFPLCPTAHTCAFLTPSHISCEIENQEGNNPPYLVTTAMCQNENGQVSIDAAGAMTRCDGPSCIGNPGIGTPRLAAGQSVNLGPFACAVAADSVTCTVGSGQGFHITNGAALAVGT
jgi:hypothetical protein